MYSSSLSRELVPTVTLLAFLIVGALVSGGAQVAESKYERIEQLIAATKYPEAESLARKLIAKVPSARAYDLLGLALEFEGKLADAERMYLKALELSPALVSSRVRLGIIYGKTGNHIGCIERLEASRQQISDDPEALFYLCRSYLERGDTAKALELAAAIEGLQEQDPAALLSAARLLSAKELYAQALPLLKKAAASLTGSAEARYSLALALFKLRRYEEMWSHLDEAARLDPKAARTPLLYAMGLLDMGRIAEAKDHIRRAQELQPANPFAAYLWSRALVEEGSYREAIDVLRPLAREGSDDPELHALLVTALRRNGDFQKALDYALKTAQRFPNDPGAQLNTGQELESMGNLEQAEQYFRKARELAGARPQARKMATFNLAIILAKRIDYQGAAKLLEEMVRADPGDVHARVELGQVRTKVGQYNSALTVLLEATNLDPRNQRAHFLLGNVLVRLGKQEEADRQFRIFQELETAALAGGRDKPGVYTKARN